MKISLMFSDASQTLFDCLKKQEKKQYNVQF